MRDPNYYLDLARQICQSHITREVPLHELLGLSGALAALDRNNEVALALMQAALEIIDMDPREQAHNIAERLQRHLELVKKQM